MTRIKSLTAALMAATLLMPVLAHADGGDGTPKKKHKVTKAEAAAETDRMRELQDQMKAQQAEIDALKAQIAGVPAPQPETDPIATPIAQKAAAEAAAAQAEANGFSGSINDLKSTTAGLTTTVMDTQKKVDALESPSAIHYKGVLIQPGGFAAAESVYRNRSYNSNIATPFSATPYGNSNNYYVSEFNGSAQQSRLSLNVTAPFSWGKAGAYFEGDFLGAGVTSNNNQTNSYVFRVRSFFGQATLNSGFTFQGGQMFTLATEDKKGVLAGQGAEALPPTIDPNYIVGFMFGRQYSLRFAQSLAGGKINAALGVEGAQTILAATPNAPGNFFFGGAGSSGGLFNSTANYSNNVMPDFVLKVAADPGPGLGHYELGGIIRVFRDRVYSQSSFSTGAGTDSTVGTNYSTPGGGIFASARVPVTKFADVALKGAFGKGIARYEASNLGDVTVRPTGQLEPLKTGSALFELDLHPTPKLDIFFLGGAEYLQRTVYNVATGAGITQVGYGATSTQNDFGCHIQAPPTANSGYAFAATPSCTGATRYLYEIVPGITYRFFNSPTKGRFQLQATYAYLDRQAWQGYASPGGAAYSTTSAAGYAAGTGFTSAQGIASMVHTSLRYYLP